MRLEKISEEEQAASLERIAQTALMYARFLSDFRDRLDRELGPAKADPQQEVDAGAALFARRLAEAYWKCLDASADLRSPTRKDVADELGINRRTLYRLIKDHGITWPPPRP